MQALSSSIVCGCYGGGGLWGFGTPQKDPPPKAGLVSEPKMTHDPNE